MKPRFDLLWRATETPSAPALETPERTWSFGDLAECAGRAATLLRDDVADDGSPIALMLPGDVRFVVWLHAVTLASRAVLPLNARLTAAEIALQLRDARTTCVLGDAADQRLHALRGLVPGLAAIEVPEFVALPAAHGSLVPCAKPERMPRGGEGAGHLGPEPYAVIFTSGTSGRAKGACLTRGNFEASAAASATRLGAAVSGRWLACMPLFHVGGLSILARSVMFGGAVRLMTSFDAAELSNALDQGDIDGISLVPTMLSRLLAHRGERRAPPGLRVLLLGGAPASPELVSRALALGYPVCPTYGLTEATSQVATAAPPAPGATSTAPLLPLDGVEVRVVTDGRDADAGEPGEIVVRGPTVMSGYLNDPESTAGALRGGWLHTGDVGLLDAGGGLHVLDRRDDLIVSGGENVYPAEIEAVLLEHASITDAGVAGVADADLGARVVAWIVLEPGAVPDAAAMAAYCRTRLAGFKRPREFRFVAALPRNAAGKLLRRKLTEAAS